MRTLIWDLIWKLIAMILFVCLICVTLIFFATSETHSNKSTEHDTNFVAFCDKIEPDWLRMISSALTTLDYYEKHVYEMVTDVAVGTRIMEAQMNILLKTKLNFNLTILQDLKALQSKSKFVGDTILLYYKKNIKNFNDTQLQNRMTKNLHWIESSSTWETPAVKQWKTLVRNTAIEPAENMSMDTSFGERSDGCIFGTFEICTIPDYCIDFMWREPGTGYLLTHQILFHYMIVQNNCFSGKRRISYESQNLTDPKIFLETLCRRVLTESTLIESLNYPEDMQDLFVEQILVCSLAGYNDFLTRNWTNVILEWSGDDGTLGCYTSASDQGSKLRRVKRWDNFYKIGNETCSVHMGALILGVIGQQLRYFLEMCYENDL